MIGGFILSEDEPTKVLVRAIGPSLAKSGEVIRSKIQFSNFMGPMAT